MSINTRPTLLVVDVQNDFCPGGALAVPGGDQIIDPLNIIGGLLWWKKIMPTFYSRDWHPPETRHFEKWPIHCVQETEGAKFHPRLNLTRGLIVTKGVSTEDDGYSPFEGTVKLRSMTFDEALRYFNVTDLYIGGLATDYCVKAACLDAVKHGYKTYLLTDACRAVNLKPTDEADALEEMQRAGVIFTTTDEVISRL